MTSRDRKTSSGDEPTAEVISLGQPRETEPPASRVKRLQRELRALARAQLEEFASDLSTMAQRASDIADGGEAFEVGARELAARIAEDLRHKSQTLEAIARRRTT
jgi:hypothetical protein